jgi:hypothetical protein
MLIRLCTLEIHWVIYFVSKYMTFNKKIYSFIISMKLLFSNFAGSFKPLGDMYVLEIRYWKCMLVNVVIISRL